MLELKQDLAQLKELVHSLIASQSSLPVGNDDAEAEFEEVCSEDPGEQEQEEIDDTNTETLSTTLMGSLRRKAAQSPTSLLEEAAKEREETPKGQPLDAELATYCVHKARNSWIQKEDMARLEKKYPEPENCAIGPVKLNKGLEEVLSPHIKQQEESAFRAQCVQARGLIALAQAMQDVKKACATNSTLATTFETMMDAFTLFSDQNRRINVTRRFTIRPDLKAQFRHLCKPEVPVTDNLFGDELEQSIKEVEESSKLKSQLSVRKDGFKKFKSSRGAHTSHGQSTFHRQKDQAGTTAGFQRGRSQPRGRGRLLTRGQQSKRTSSKN